MVIPLACKSPEAKDAAVKQVAAVLQQEEEEGVLSWYGIFECRLDQSASKGVKLESLKGRVS